MPIQAGASIPDRSNIAENDRHVICEIGDMILSGNKQCYSADAVLRMMRRLMRSRTVRAALKRAKARIRREFFGPRRKS